MMGLPRKRDVPWSKEEAAALTAAVNRHGGQHGAGKWELIQRSDPALASRSVQQCRQRWQNMNKAKKAT